MVHALAHGDEPQHFAMGLEVPPLVVLHGVDSLVAHHHIAVLALDVHDIERADPLPHAVEQADREVGAGVANQNQQRLVILCCLAIVDKAHPDLR